MIQSKIQAAQSYAQSLPAAAQGPRLTAERCDTLLQQNPTPNIQRQCQNIQGQQTTTTPLTAAQCQTLADNNQINTLSTENKQLCQQYLSQQQAQTPIQTQTGLTVERCQMLSNQNRINNLPAEDKATCQQLLSQQQTTAQTQTTPITTQGVQTKRTRTQTTIPTPGVTTQTPIQTPTTSQQISIEECFQMYNDKANGEQIGFKILQQCQDTLSDNKNSLTAIQCQRITEWNADGEVFIPEILQACQQGSGRQAQLSLTKNQCFQMLFRYVSGENIDSNIIQQCSTIIADEIEETDCPKVLNINSQNSNIFSLTTVQFCQQRNTQQTAQVLNQPRTTTNTQPTANRATGLAIKKPSFTIIEALFNKLSERF